MCLYYESQEIATIIGTKTASGTRSTWSLTDAYQSEGLVRPTKSFAIGGFSKINFDILYTMGAAETTNSIELKIEVSPDNINWYRIPNESVTAGTSTLTAREFTFVGINATDASISLGLDIFNKFMRVSVKETGVSANFGGVYIEYTLSGK